MRKGYDRSKGRNYGSFTTILAPLADGVQETTPPFTWHAAVFCVVPPLSKLREPLTPERLICEPAVMDIEHDWRVMLPAVKPVQLLTSLDTELMVIALDATLSI